MEQLGASYPVSDPISNLRIKVRIEKVLAIGGGDLPTFDAFISASSPPAGGGAISPPPNQERRLSSGTLSPPPVALSSTVNKDAEEYVFRWQSKVFSGREFALYSASENCRTPLEQQYYKDVLELRSRDGRPTDRLSSYVEGDPLVSDVLTLSATERTTTDAAVETVGDRVATMRHRKITPQSRLSNAVLQTPVNEHPASEFQRKQRQVGESLQTMCIVANLGAKGGDVATTTTDDEKVLCTLRLVNDRMLFVEPDFCYGIDKPYKVEGRMGIFRYSIENNSTGSFAISQPKSETAFLALKESRLFGEKESAFDLPEEDTLHTVVLGEILSAQDFEYDNLYVHYLIELPNGRWRNCSIAQPQHPLQGLTPICKTSSKSDHQVAYFGFPFELNLAYKTDRYDPEEGGLPQWPQLLICVMSLDQWSRHRTEGYGFVSLPTLPGLHTATVHTWRPYESPTGELRRFFVGGSAELESATYARVPQESSGSGPHRLSKFGLISCSAGSVRVRFRVMHQCRRFLPSGAGDGHGGMDAALLAHIGATATMHSSIVRVLEAFQRARHRMVQAREHLFVDQQLV